MAHVLLVGLGLLGGGLWLGANTPPTPYKSGRVFTHPADHPTRRFGDPSYYGTVTAVTWQSITIRYDGGEGISWDRLRDGTEIELRVKYAPRPPKRFEVSATLADGGYRRDWPGRHRLSDVRVGDVVYIR